MRSLWLNAFVAVSLMSPGAASLAATGQPAPAPARGLPDNQISPLSLSMLRAGEAQLSAGYATTAMDSFEAALAADPRNRQAWLGMARAAEAQGLPGKAVRYYREALAIDPNDVQTLALQGNVLVERGAKARAQANLDRIKTLCAAPCAPADKLSAAIARGPTPTATAAVTPAEPKASN